METFTLVPPGFRFHPTDEELVDYYLRKKITSRRIDLDVIKDVDLYKIEPWDLQDICRIGTEDQQEYYFFSHKDKKYPTGTRTNRATVAGFWKATGRDKAIYSKQELIGMRKTLVFYKGRAPNGQKSDWIMHEYRLETDENGAPQEEGWVVCRVFKKRIATTTVRRMSEHDQSPCWYDIDHHHQVSFMPDLDQSSKQNNPIIPNFANYHTHYNSCKKESDLAQYYNQIPHHEHYLQLPLLESPKPPHLQTNNNNITLMSSAFGLDINEQVSELTQDDNNNNNLHAVDEVTDWRVLDKFVASQLSQEDVCKANMFQDQTSLLLKHFDKEILEPEIASTSASSCQVALWK